jgi:hypothetical protein
MITYRDGAKFRTNIKLNVNNITNLKTTLQGAQNKYIKLDLTGSSIMAIPEAAFENFHSLTSVDIPNNITRIDYSAFFACSSLTSVTIPNSVTSVV